jgi:hypothetical protein
MPLYSPKIPHGLDWDQSKSFCQVKSLVRCNIFNLYRNSRIWEKTAQNSKYKCLNVCGRCSRNFWPLKCATCSCGNHASGKELDTSHKLAFPWTCCGKFFSRTPHFSIRWYVLASTVSGPDGHCHTKGSCIPETSSNARRIEEKSSGRNCGHFTAR